MSNINPQSIDGAYPIAGQDNNSQGFRDNFTNTVNNFTFAAAELTDLQQNAVLKAPLGSVGQTGTPTNEMNYAFLTHAQLLGTVETKNQIAEPGVGGDFEVDWESGHFQLVSVQTTAGMTFANWPSSTNVWSRLRLQITATTLSNVTISGTYIENLQNIQGAVGNVLTLNTGIYQFDFSSYDAGAHVWIQDVTRNYDEPLSFNTLTVSGNVLAEGLSVFGNTRVGLAGKPSGQYHTVVGNITQTTAGGPVYINTTGNVLATGGVFSTATINGTTTVNGNISVGQTGAVSGQFHSVVGNITQTSSGGVVYINTTGNVLATGLRVFGNTSVGLAGAVSGQFHSVVGNITQTSSGGAVYFNTTGNVSASAVNAGSLTSGNITLNDPIGAASKGTNITVNGTIEYKSQDQSNNASVNTSTKSLTLAPGGDQFVLININGNCSIGYNASITPGHQTTVHVKNSAGALAYVIVPNENNNTGNAFIGLATGITGTFVFTSYGTDAGNVFVTVSR